MKSYTDLEQSKKLVEFLSLESADMSWVSCDDGKQKYYQAENKKIILNYEKKHWLPCWSLTALLNILPEPDLVQNHEGLWMLKVWDTKGFPWSVGGYINPIDACYSMIIKLHKLKLL